MKKATKISASVRELIEGDLKKNPNGLYVIARRYGVSKSVVETISQEMRNGVPNRVAKPVTVSLDPEEIPARLRPYVVEAKPVCAPWSMSEDIRSARQAYDEGNVELCTGRIRRRHGDVLVLYCIPRKTPDTRRSPYFASIYEG